MTRPISAITLVLFCACCTMLLCALPAALGDAPAGSQLLKGVIFSRYTALAGNSERARRFLSPLTTMRLEHDLAQSGRSLAGQSINLADERFTVYVPAQRPPKGFGLLVFVPPWQDARLPAGWSTVLDRYGFIFVSAEKSGNPESVFGRREPLAVLAAANIMALYPVDPERVYISGFSGGSRVALRIALAYPDVFRGAMLNAGSDPIGERDIPLPPRDLFLKFLSAIHLAYVTGDRDTENVADDAISLRSVHGWCMFNTDSLAEFREGHTVATASALDAALDYLQKAADAEPAKRGYCISAIEQTLAVKLQNTEALITAGRRGEAEKQLAGIDEHFGGFAAPRSVELASRLR